MNKIKLAAVCAFGIEAIVKRELNNLGYENTLTDNGWIYFDGEIEDIPKTNINLRSADRIMLVMGQFEALTYEELFDKTYELPWEEWITEDGLFTVKGKSVKSTLFSVSDCQSIVKKAIVEKLKKKYNTEWFKETGAEFTIQISIHKNIATITIDTTGSREGLFKRGYRENSIKAPLKETLAAALIQLSYWNKDRILLDPMCGSGTIPIEAALIGRNIAPGIERTYASEKWPKIPIDLWKKTRIEARRKIDFNSEIKIYASDISKKAISIAEENAYKAGVDDCIEFKVQDIKNIELPGEYGILITNPPYGERIGKKEEIQKIHKAIGSIFGKNKTWSNYIITSDTNFERLYGKKADRKRKLFNGDVKVNYYQYYGERP